jgi:hypothetical protein
MKIPVNAAASIILWLKYLSGNYSRSRLEDPDFSRSFQLKKPGARSLKQKARA